MSNTGITPSVGAVAAAGVAAAMGLALQSPAQAQGSLVGIPPTVVSVSPLNPGCGLPVSWSALGQGAAGAAAPPLPWRQAKFSVVPGSVFGTGGSLQIQGSPDGQTWTVLAAIASSEGADDYTAANDIGLVPGLRAVQRPDGSLVLAAPDAGGYPYLRASVAGGDGTTSLTVEGNISTTGAV